MEKTESERWSRTKQTHAWRVKRERAKPDKTERNRGRGNDNRTNFSAS